jgi:hypothetical protein
MKFRWICGDLGKKLSLWSEVKYSYSTAETYLKNIAPTKVAGNMGTD